MQRYFISRLIQSVFLLFGVLLLVFVMVRVTGDPAALMMPREASPEDVEAFREKMGFNDPTLVQFGRFIAVSSPVRSQAILAIRCTSRHRRCRWSWTGYQPQCN